MRKIPFLLLCLFPLTANAVGINTDAALPVPKGHFLYRTQVRYARSTEDLSGAGRRRHQLELPQVFVYGPAERTALFFIVPVFYRDLNAATPRRTGGVGDLTLLGRYEIFKRDWTLRTFRIALLGGLEIPSGDNPFSSNSIDLPLGIVTSYQTHRNEFDIDFRYKINTESRNVDHGDNFIYNLAYQHRVLPWRLPEAGVPNQFNAVLELNGEYTQRDGGTAADAANSGGHLLLLSPGLQYVTKRIILEASFQYPITQNPNGGQLKTSWRTNGGMRVLF